MKKAEEIKDIILEEYKKGNIVISGVDGLQIMPIKEFIKQPTAGMLYDLNRCEAVVLTFLPDPKWINDYAVAKVIIELKNRIKELESNMDEVLKQNAVKFVENMYELEEVPEFYNEWIKTQQNG